MTMTHNRTRRPTLPGEILAELYLAPHDISIAKFAEAVGMSRKHMSAIVNGRASITADLYDAEQRLAESESRPQLLPIFG
jgi:addiction module HigA family antidote